MNELSNVTEYAIPWSELDPDSIRLSIPSERMLSFEDYRAGEG
jgi:hypothetical protein